MTNSKAPWLTRGGAIALMAAAGIALAACSGGGGLNEDESAGLQQELKEARAQATADAAARMTAVAEAALAQTAKETAKAEATAARTDQEAAETALRLAKETAAGQVSDAEADADTARKAAKDALEAKAKADAALIVARAKQKEAEDERDAAKAAEAAALRQLQAAQRVATTEEQRRQQAEAEQDRLEQVAEDARQELIQVQAQQVFLGLVTEAGTTDPTRVTASYNENASVTTAPSVTFSSTTGRAANPWFVTSFSNRTASNVDRLDVYTDVERLPDIPFKDSDYNDSTTDNVVVDQAGELVSNGMVVDAEGDVINRLRVTGTRDDTASSSFPRTTVTPKSFNLVHRGMNSMEFNDALDDEFSTVPGASDGFGSSERNTPEFRAALVAAGITSSQFSQYSAGRGFRDEVRHPFRYSVEERGSLGGAGGTYRCGGASKAETCDVDYRGGRSFDFVGAWSFAPSSGTVGVDVVDETYMYFGWWSRENLNPGQDDTVWSFRAFHGGIGVDDGRDMNVDDVNGTATYQGPAVGYYAVYQPLGTQSGHGEFNATATLTADFDSATETLEGRIDQFSGHSDWFLTLKRGTINNGTASVDTDGVTWSIGGIPHDGGEWEAAFYSNLDETDDRMGVVPSGVAGTFEAEYSTVGRLIGAFGAHCRTGC